MSPTVRRIARYVGLVLAVALAVGGAVGGFYVWRAKQERKRSLRERDYYLTIRNQYGLEKGHGESLKRQVDVAGPAAEVGVAREAEQRLANADRLRREYEEAWASKPHLNLPPLTDNGVTGPGK